MRRNQSITTAPPSGSYVTRTARWGKVTTRPLRKSGDERVTRVVQDSTRRAPVRTSSVREVCAQHSVWAVRHVYNDLA